MPPIWLRLTVAIVFLFIWCAPYYLEAASVGSSDELSITVTTGEVRLALPYLILTLLTGFIVGWPALPLPGVVYLALLPLGENPADSDLHTYASDYWLFVGSQALIVIVIGCLIGIAFWLGRQGRDKAPHGSGDVGASPNQRLLSVPAVLLVAVSVMLVVLLVRANGTQVETPKLNIEGVTRTPPKPTNTELRLLATDVESCGSGNDRLVDLATTETATGVVISAALEIDRQFPCGFSNGARVPFVVALEDPLGQRAVIDDSGGTRTVIFTAAIGRRLESLTTEDAEKFLLSQRPGSDARCKRKSPDFFSCTFVREASGRRTLRGVQVLANGELAIS